MTVSPMLHTGAAHQLSDTSSGNNNDIEPTKKFPFAPLGRVHVSFGRFARWLCRRCGWTRHSGAELDTPPRQTSDERQRILDDERLDMQIQQEMEDERKLAAIKKRRNQRRRKYQQFLEPYTLTVTESDLYTASDGNTMKGSGSGSTCSCASKNRQNDVDRFEDEVVETRPSNTEPVPLLLCMPTSSLSDAPHEQMLRHPFKISGNTLADVEASCSVCLLDYEEGDRVVFSTRTVCPHAFHEDCIMKWLEKGKKRCPICRDFFVPGGAMDNKAMIQHAEDDECAIRNTKSLSRGNMDDHPTDIEKCLHHEETNVGTSPSGRSRSGTIVSTTTSVSMDSSESDEASL